MKTLLGTKTIEATFESGESGEVVIRQIPVRDYDAGFKCFTDEIALVAFLVGKPREFALTLSPDSYEEVLSSGKELNERGFFASCRRRIEANTQKEALEMAALTQIPAEARKQILEQGAKMMASQNSSAPSSGPQPRRV